MHFAQRIHWRAVLTLVALILLPAAPALVEEQQVPAPNQVKLNGHTFTLPPGFEIELAASSPQVDRPITIDFDEQGRLYAADSSGSNEKVAVQLEKKPHRIVRLEDTDGDGRFDKSIVFADKMMFPEGTMWYNGSLYVAAPPSIWKLTDTDGDGVADQRSEWFQGKTLTGCANDLHGPYLGPDGWIYWCKGAFAQQTYPPLAPGGRGVGGEGDKRPFKTRASHVFRCRPDGSQLEPVMAGGMDNPVDLVFTPGGERIITTTFFQYPAGGKRDGLIHIVYGGIYGKDYDVIYEHKWTSPHLMPVLTHMGPAAPCGLHRYESDAFGPKYRDNIFACQFNLQKVSRHVLVPEGSTFKCQDSDFVVSDNKDFHPTDAIEDADGSLLIVDTGGWYKLCCPTSQLVKADVLGAIYRVRKKGMPRGADPRGLKLDWAKMSVERLTSLLDDPRPAVRKRAVAALAANPPGATALVTRLARVGSVEARRNAVWVAARINDPKASDAPMQRWALYAGLEDPDEIVRQAAIHAVGLWRDREAAPGLRKLLESPSLHNRRAAAEALGRIGDPKAVPALLTALGKNPDQVLQHSLTYALIEIGDRERTAAGLKSDNPRIRQAALTALDQMAEGKLQAANVLAEVNAQDARLKEAAWWIASRHPEWGGQLSVALRRRLEQGPLTEGDRTELLQQLAKLSRSPAIQTLLAEQAGDASIPVEGRRLVLQALARANLKEPPAAWFESLVKVLDGKEGTLVGEAATTARALRWPKTRPEALVAALLRVGIPVAPGQPLFTEEIRLRALAALPDGVPKLNRETMLLLSSSVQASQPALMRGLAAEVLSKARLAPDQFPLLTDALLAIGPMEIERVLQAYAAPTGAATLPGLVRILEQVPARTSIRPETLRAVFAKAPAALRKQADDFAASLQPDLVKQMAQLDDLTKKLPAGDVRRGQFVFNSQKAACAACHTIGYLGGKIGPDLTRIGGIRTERDLLESIVFPNASFVRSYESVFVSLKNGKTYNGILRNESADEIHLVLGADQEVRLSRADIEEMLPGRVSVMPSGLDQQLAPQDLADLVAFLKASR